MREYIVACDYLIGKKYRPAERIVLAKNATEAKDMLRNECWQNINNAMRMGFSRSRVRQMYAWPFHIEAHRK